MNIRVFALICLALLSACEPYQGARTNCWAVAGSVEVTRSDCGFERMIDARAY